MTKPVPEIKNTKERFRALHRLGQNFLVDRGVLSDIIERSNAGEDDVILEIGPGQGVLTRALLERGVSRLHAVELDERLRPGLEKLASQAPRLSLYWGDAMKFDYALLAPFPTKAVANIPYNITTPLIWKLAGLAAQGLTYHLYMVQKEAADRLTAPADTRERYPLGVTLEAMGKVMRVRKVPASCFRPVPGVESALIEIVLCRNFELARDPFWSELLHRAFAHRRKTLLNNLKGFRGLDADGWTEIINGSGASPSDRAEDLEWNTWLALCSGARKIIIPASDQWNEPE